MQSSLETVIEDVRERIRRFRERYEQNEMAVRRQLIEPILRGIGWDPEDPEQVIPNFSLEEGFPDSVEVSRTVCMYARTDRTRESQFKLPT